MANETIKKLSSMCISAKKAALGNKLDTLVDDLKAGRKYSGDDLTEYQIGVLDTMCGPAREVALGTTLDRTFKASKNDTEVTKITDGQAKLLNKMCLRSSKVVDGTVKGLGSLLQWCADKINAGAGTDKHNLVVDYNPAEATLSITKGGVEVAPGVGVLNNNDEIVITATEVEGFEVVSLTVNDVPVVSGSSYTVTSDITVNVVAKPTYLLTITETNATVTVTDGESPIVSGDTIYDGEIITISAVPAETYTGVTLLVNGQEFVSGASLTVEGPVTIVATGIQE